MLSGHRHINLHAVTLSLAVGLLLVACDASDPIAPAPTEAARFTSGATGNPAGEPMARIQGRVTSAATGAPVAGAIVRIGDAAATTGADGRYRMIVDLPPAQRRLRSSAAGFADAEMPITLTSGQRRTEHRADTDRRVRVRRLRPVRAGQASMPLGGSFSR